MSTYKRGRGVFRLLCLLVCALALSSQVLAAGSGTLTLRYSYGNAKFQLYCVANASGNFTSEFTDCGVTLPGSGSSNSELRAAAQNLAAYVNRESISETQSGRVSGGSVSFSNLVEGWYLVTGSSATLGNRTYTPIPFLVYVDEEVSAYVKGEDVTQTPGPTPDPDPNPGPKPDPNPDVEPDPEPTPDVPDVPDTPDVPNEPEAPETPSDPSVPQTSDSSLTGLWLALCLLALGVLCLLKFTQPREDRKTRR